MTRYIDAEQAIHLIENDALLQVYYSKSDAIDCINVTPTADVQEVNHAKFEFVNSGKGVCSNCHRLDSIDNLAKYCRYCGAKIDESATDICVGTY